MAAPRCIRHWGVRCNRNTLLRRIKRRARSRHAGEKISVLGVDEWAWRKGQGNYGTILVWPDPSLDEVRQQRSLLPLSAKVLHQLKRFDLVLPLIEVMRQAGIRRGLADKWLRLSECPARVKRTLGPGMVEDFREELWLRWEQGQQEGKQLFAEIRQRGYVGSYASLMRFLAPWRVARRAVGKASQPRETIQLGAVRHITPRVAVVLLSKPKPQLNGKQREIVEILKRRCPGFATMRHLVLSFRGIVCGGKARA